MAEDDHVASGDELELKETPEEEEGDIDFSDGDSDDPEKEEDEDEETYMSAIMYPNDEHREYSMY